MRRLNSNPVLAPRGDSWESYAVFNPSVVKCGDEWAMLYRSIGPDEPRLGKKLRMSRIGVAWSKDGVNFDRREVLWEPETPWEFFGAEDPRVTYFEGKYYIFYTALSGYPFNRDNIKVGLAISSDLKTVDERYLITPFNAKAMTLFPERINGKVTAILTVNSDNPPSTIAIIQVDQIEQLWRPEVWYEWYTQHHRFHLPLSRINCDHVEVGGTPVRTDQGWLFLYAHIQNYSNNDRTLFGVECALLGATDPTKILARTDVPFLVPEEKYELEGTVPDVIFPTSLNIDGSTVRTYYGATDTTIAIAECGLNDFMAKIKVSEKVVPKLQKMHAPLITPRSSVAWEANGTFNPGCFTDGKNVHLFYRAQSDLWTSTLGYCRFNAPHSIAERLPDPAYIPRAEFEVKRSKEGYSGCEDARLTLIGDRVYMLYTAYDGVNPPAAAVTAIPLKDLQEKNWKQWSMPRLLSKPGAMDKNACLFPEKINDHYMILHRIEPNILVETIPADILEDLDREIKFDNNAVLAGPEQDWESAKIGANCPPIRTDKGWLLVYHGVDKRDSQYRVGLMLLDLKDPTRIVGRTRYPVIEPTLPWERVGVVNNVVFPCGAAVHGEILYIYYGGADTVIGLAWAPLAQVLDYLV